MTLFYSFYFLPSRVVFLVSDAMFGLFSPLIFSIALAIHNCRKCAYTKLIPNESTVCQRLTNVNTSRYEIAMSVRNVMFYKSYIEKLLKRKTNISLNFWDTNYTSIRLYSWCLCSKFITNTGQTSFMWWRSCDGKWNCRQIQALRFRRYALICALFMTCQFDIYSLTDMCSTETAAR